MAQAFYFSHLMTKTALLLLILFYSSLVYSQNDLFVLKKRFRSVEIFKKDSYITFRLRNRQWYTGYITAVQNDSFYVTQVLIHYRLMGADTLHFSGLHVAINDVYAMPRKKELFDYVNDHVKIIYGKESWVYVKNGLLFQLAGGGYALLNIANDLIKNNSPFSGRNKYSLGIGAAVFLLGELLHLNYKPTLRLRKKYHLEYVNLKNSKSTIPPTSSP